jgi:hypothetical protein
MDAQDFVNWRRTCQAAIVQLKNASVALPAGERRHDIEAKIKDAENVLARADAMLAKELGYRLHDCTYPPQIMLWKEAEQAHVCPNPECGHRRPRPQPVNIQRRSWADVRRGRY